ncbi:hypothetical protein G6F62_011011 [Rhizopus arrhizus]|nr:hypothetical protein G6F62_011011 [Rhizopus arrhizus]
MKSIQFVLLASFLLTATAETIHRIPMYHKRSSRSDFISAAASSLKNGMMGGIVQIGNPPQNFTLAFDTSTGFTWVRGTTCLGENCLHRMAYDPKNSTTAISMNHKFTMDYGQGIAFTDIYLDTLRYAGLSVKMPFGSAYCMKNFDQGFDGFIGLGRNVNLTAKGIVYAKRDIPASGFVPSAYQQGSGLGSSQFGMYTTNTGPGFSQDIGSPSQMDTATTNNNKNNNNTTTNASKNPNETPNTGSTTSASGVSSGVASGGWGTFSKRTYHNEPAGYLVLGGIDVDAIQGKLYYVKTYEDNGSGNWAVPVHQAKFIHDLSFTVKKHTKAVLSTSTDVIGLPNKQADEFKKRWYAVYDEPDNTYLIPCCLMDKLTSFQIQLGSLTVTLPPHYWSHPRDTETCCEMCRTHIGRSDSDQDYILELV